MAGIKQPEPNMVELSMRLLKQGTLPADALRAGHGLSPTPSEQGTLFIGQAPASPPGWTKFLGQIAPQVPATLRTQTCSAVLFLEAGPAASKRLFAICFGQGHHALDSDVIERRFGLLVVLNSVSRDRLRTLDSASLDSTVMQRRIQASRDSDLIDFGINANRDLLRLASGSPTSTNFANMLAGKDALHLRGRVAPQKIAARCAEALTLFQATDYRKHFDFIDHIKPVEDRVLSKALDAVVFQELTALVAGTNSDLHLAIPDILFPESVMEMGYFGVGLNPGAKTGYPEIAIEDYVGELVKGDFSKIGDMPALRASHEIRVIADGEGDKAHKRKLYSCFVFETKMNNLSYVLFDGEWYEVEASFAAEIDSIYNSLLKPSFLPMTTCRTEQQLIASLTSDPTILCMDQTRSAPKGAPRAALEACDFLGNDRRLIHLKDGHGSAPLSHLWNQALVSAESFVRDQTFRDAFRRAVRKRERKYVRTGFTALLPTARGRVVPAKFPIVFGVMRRKYAKTGTLGLPFFSKVALRAAAERLSLMGFPVELHLIAKQ